MNQPCGCCAGIQIITPESEVNPPGMSSLSYRVGTYATFYETMLARLSTLQLTIPSPDGLGHVQTIFPLKHLTTRDPSDPSIALLDAWAIVADVLTFYQERIANEGYLGTAAERRSLLELARLVNYTLRPGVSASVYLAFTVQTGFSGIIPAGTRAQSMPGSGQMPQFYETSTDLNVSDVWNNLKPRLTRPQIITAGAINALGPATLRTLYVQGVSTNLKPGDAVIIAAEPFMALRLLDAVTPQAPSQRTQLHFREAFAETLRDVNQVAAAYIAQGANLFPGSVLAEQAAAQLKGLSTGETTAAVVRSLQKVQDQAAQRNFTRLGSWLSDLLDDLNAAITRAAANPAVIATPAAATTAQPSAISAIAGIVPQLALAPSLQPPDSTTLPRSVSTVFAPQSDTAARLLAAFHPAAADTLYAAWAAFTPASSAATASAARVKAGIFANNFAGASIVFQIAVNQHGAVGGGGVITRTVFFPPTLGDAVRDLVNGDTLTALPLDAVYDQITVGSFVAVDRPVPVTKDTPDGRKITFHKVTGVQTVSRETEQEVEVTGQPVPPGEIMGVPRLETSTPSGFSAKVTQLTLDPPWLSDLNATDFQAILKTTPPLRQTVIYAQSEELTLAEEPLDTDVQGSAVELGSLYDGLESGRWVIVSGNRTDIPGTTGVNGAELVMVGSVSQDNPASPEDTVHTSLKLANGLAYTYDSSTVTIYANVAAATNGQAVGQVLGNGDGSQAFQTFALSQSPLTYVSATTPSGIESTLTVTVNDIKWQETYDISALGPADHSYITQTNDASQTSVIFGNGTNGARVPTGTANVKAVYRYGMGSAGNADAKQVSQLATRPLGAQAVINPLPATGGADPDTVSQARSNTPLAVKALDRLVSVQDYADFSRVFAGIGKAAAVRLSTGRRQVVYVTIAGVEDIPISLTSSLYQNLVQSLQQFGDPHQPILVGVRSSKLLVIFAGIQVLPNYQFVDVAPKVRAALLSTFSFDNRQLGQTAFLSEAIAAMQAVLGVAFVNVTIFDSVAQNVSAAALTSLSTTLIRRGHVTAKLAHVDPHFVIPQTNPTAQDAFKIQPAEIVYLTSAIPDTLTLTEITATNPGPPPLLRNKPRNKPRRTRIARGTI
jgi:hypothetical protein